MATDDPRDVEDQYFFKEDLEKIKELRKKLDTKRSEEDKNQRMETHWMKCPKCGSGLEEINHSDVMIDRCPDCKGIWLDKGELELLTEGDARFTKSFLGRLFS